MCDTNIQKASTAELLAKILITTFSGILAILHLFVPELQVDTVGVVLVIITISPWIIPFLRQHIKSGEILGLKFELLENTVKNQGDDILNQQKIVNMLVIYSLCDQAYKILHSLSSMPEYIYHNDENFRRWMYVLLDGGLIEPKYKGGWLKFDDSLDNKNMVESMKPTPAGELLISLRGAPKC